MCVCVSLQALAGQPRGTFICRFSMSQPGSLVLSCKTSYAAHTAADPDDNLLHAIIKVKNKKKHAAQLILNVQTLNPSVGAHAAHR